MTRLDILRALYEAVKAGERPMRYGRADPCGLGQARIHLDGCVHGSVDAALAFIAATLPGYLASCDTTGFAQVLNLDFPITRTFSERVSNNPATALLLAGLAAHIAQEEGK